jgi:hypothetical protein
LDEGDINLAARFEGTACVTHDACRLPYLRSGVRRIAQAHGRLGERLGVDFTVIIRVKIREAVSRG